MSRRSKARGPADTIPDGCRALIHAASGLYVVARLQEGRMSVSAANAGERLRAYRLDSDAGRRFLGVNSADRLADGAFAVTGPEPCLLLIELKGEGIDHAVSQLRATVGPIRERLRAAACDALLDKLLAIVVASGSAPPGHQKSLDAFTRQTRVPIRIKTGVDGSVPLRDLLLLFGIDIGR